MAGKTGTHKKIMRGLDTLQKVYGDRTQGKIGASMVVNKENHDDIPNVWKWCRERNIAPNLEMMVANGKGDDEAKMLSVEEWKDLKLGLLKIDQNEFGYTWPPYTPLAGYNCFQCKYNLYITVEGDVRPCSSVHEEPAAANIRNYTLAQILQLPYFQRARHAEDHLEGKCGECTEDCLGCRGLATSVSGSMFAEDPSCWRASTEN